MVMVVSVQIYMDECNVIIQFDVDKEVLKYGKHILSIFIFFRCEHKACEGIVAGKFYLRMVHIVLYH